MLIIIYIMKTFKNDLSFGKINERKIYNLLISKYGKENIINDSNSYLYYDFKIPSKKYIIELKSRHIKHNQYKTTILGFDKYQRFHKFKEDNKEYKFIVIYKFEDGIYYLELNNDILKYCDVRMYQRNQRKDKYDRVKDHIFIPIKFLKRIELLN